MPELRKDPVIGRWVIIAAERAKRPHRYSQLPVAQSPPDNCPFCPGHEADTPPEVLSYRDKGTFANQRGWWVRVVPNKFPALEIAGPLKRSGIGMYDTVSGVGAHEVVIETLGHYDLIGDLPEKQVEEIIWAYRDRILDLKKDSRFHYILIFKNHGFEAGASIDHPHSQIIALPIVPKRVLEELDGSEKYFKHKERCVFCDIIDQEQRERERILHENESFVALLPFASRFPYETWILPRRHSLHFHDIQKHEVIDLARILRLTLAKLRILLNDPPYNFMIHSTPLTIDGIPYYHWHIEMFPKTTKTAGFEWGTGFYINPIPPEDAARYLADVDLNAPQVIEVKGADKPAVAGGQ